MVAYYMLILYCKGESESESFSEVCTSRHNRWLVIDYVVIIHYFIQKKQPENCFLKFSKLPTTHSL